MEQALVRMPEILKQTLKEAAEQKGISLNAQILQILWDWKKKEEQ